MKIHDGEARRLHVMSNREGLDMGGGGQLRVRVFTACSRRKFVQHEFLRAAHNLEGELRGMDAV
jgi:hypothetical protein